MKQLLKKLSSLCGVAGNEDEVRDFIVERAEKAGGEVTLDPLGDVIVFKKGRKKAGDPVLFIAHMDEAGFKVKTIRDDGTAEIMPVGETDPVTWLGSRVWVGAGRVPGGFCMPGRKRYASTTFIPEAQDILLDVGPITREGAGKYIRKNDGVVFASDWREGPGKKVKGRAFDSRVGCAVLLKMLEGELPFDCRFAFTSRDSIKLRGAGRSSQVVERICGAGRIVFMESREALDFDAVPPVKRNLTLGRGCGIVLAETGSAYSRPLREKLISDANKAGVKWQFATRQDVFQPSSRESVYAAGGAESICLAVPVRYLRSANPVADMGDLDSALELCLMLAEKEA